MTQVKISKSNIKQQLKIKLAEYQAHQIAKNEPFRDIAQWHYRNNQLEQDIIYLRSLLK